jgi:hypothetical protein
MYVYIYLFKYVYIYFKIEYAGTLRLQDFPKMNIQNFSHQKKLLYHIQHSLKYSFSSPIRKSEVIERTKRAHTPGDYGNDIEDEDGDAELDEDEAN